LFVARAIVERTTRAEERMRIARLSAIDAEKKSPKRA
jgi:hypothetical protein